MNRSTPELAVVLAAGRGKRLRPHTDHTPKPLLPWNNEPALAPLLRSIANAGIEKVVIVTGHLGEQVEAFVQDFTTTLQIRCVAQQNLDGTADAALQALQATTDWFDAQSPLLITASDYLVQPNFYVDLVNFHCNHEQDVTVSLKSIPQHELQARSSVRYHGDLLIEEIVEKPAPGTAPSPYSANLIFIVPGLILPLLCECPVSARGEKEIQSCVNQLIGKTLPGKGLLQATPLEWSESL